MGQQRMDKPPAKTKRSAEAEEAPDELDARLRELAQDAWTAYFRDRTEESLQRANLLSAIGYSPERRKKLAQHERRLAGEEAGTNPRHPDLFWRKVWLKLVWPLVTNANGDHRAVARDLIVHMPAPLRVKCPGYPTSEPEFEQAVAKVVAAQQLRQRARHVAGMRQLGLTQGRKSGAAGPGCEQGRGEKPASHRPIRSMATRKRDVLGCSKGAGRSTGTQKQKTRESSFSRVFQRGGRDSNPRPPA